MQCRVMANLVHLLSCPSLNTDNGTRTLNVSCFPEAQADPPWAGLPEPAERGERHLVMRWANARCLMPAGLDGENLLTE